MMKSYFLSYGNKIFQKSVQRIAKEAEELGFDKIRAYSETDLSPEFRQKHSSILRVPRLGGYAIWKSHLIQNTLREMGFGDILIYADAGCTLRKKGIKRLQEYYKLALESGSGIVAFYTRGHLPMPKKDGKDRRYLEREWNKWDIIELLQAEAYLDSIQLASGAIIICKNNNSVKLVDEWCRIAEIDNYHYITDSPSLKENHPDFVEHRHDQSIFSLLAKKYQAVILEDEILLYHYSRKLADLLPIWATRLRE